MIRYCLLSALLFLSVPAMPVAAQDSTAGSSASGNLVRPQLPAAPPAAEFGAADGLTKPVWYAGESYHGKPTRIFAWLGTPAGAETEKRPGILLVHGGGGQAFKDWAKHWAERGYFALAMDTAGQGPDGKPHPEGGPAQDDNTKFQNFGPDDIKDQWTWHAVSAVLRGHALLASLPGVDADRIGMTGISWGGYLTCMTAGLDPKLKAAVPVYGCGFLGDNSYWRDRTLAALTMDSRERWLENFDPAEVLESAVCPVMLVNGMHDFAYPPDSHGNTGRLIPEDRLYWSLRVDMAHGHIWDFPEVDAFIDEKLKPGKDSVPLVRLGEMKVAEDAVSVAVAPGTPPAGGMLHFTTDTGTWQNRKWESRPVEVSGMEIKATLPSVRPLAFFVAVTDARGFTTSTDCRELGTVGNSATVPHEKLEDDFYDWNQRHAAVLKQGPEVRPEVVFIGDSITHLWGGAPDEPHGNRGRDSWESMAAGRSMLNLGFGWDRTQNVLWRIDHGELAGLQPKHLVVLIGTNNLSGTAHARENTALEIAEGITAVVRRAASKCPGAKVVLMAVLPRGAEPSDPMRKKVEAVNVLLPAVAKDSGAAFLDIGARLVGADGRITKEMMPDGVHPGPAGYAIWAEALKPLLDK